MTPQETPCRVVKYANLDENGFLYRVEAEDSLVGAWEGDFYYGWRILKDGIPTKELAIAYINLYQDPSNETIVYAKIPETTR